MIAIAIIPARMSATRFPGKPMAKIMDMPMIGHVLKRTEMSKQLTHTYVATCDREIYDYVKSIGGNAVMTSDSHQRCTDRTCEAMLKIEADLGLKVEVVVMVQGDEPMVTPRMIDLALAPFEKKGNDTKVVNLMTELDSIEEFEDPNEVKVVVDKQGKALYFSREPIPSRRKGVSIVPMMKQVCVIPFRRDYLIRFGEMQETPLERIESVDMMRVLENGDQVQMIYCEEKSFSVDTPEDLDFVEAVMRNDPLVKTYLRK